MGVGSWLRSWLWDKVRYSQLRTGSHTPCFSLNTASVQMGLLNSCSNVKWRQLRLFSSSIISRQKSFTSYNLDSPPLSLLIQGDYCIVCNANWMCKRYPCTVSITVSMEEIWSNRPYVALVLYSLLATCEVFWSHRRRDIGYTAVIFLPERMYMTLDSSASTSYPILKRHKCLLRFGKATGLHQLSSFLLSQ